MVPETLNTVSAFADPTVSTSRQIAARQYKRSILASFSHYSQQVNQDCHLGLPASKIIQQAGLGCDQVFGSVSPEAVSVLIRTDSINRHDLPSHCCWRVYAELKVIYNTENMVRTLSGAHLRCGR